MMNKKRTRSLLITAIIIILGSLYLLLMYSTSFNKEELELLDKRCFMDYSGRVDNNAILNYRKEDGLITKRTVSDVIYGIKTKSCIGAREGFERGPDTLEETRKWEIVNLENDKVLDICEGNFEKCGLNAYEEKIHKILGRVD